MKPENGALPESRLDSGASVSYKCRTRSSLRCPEPKVENMAQSRDERLEARLSAEDSTLVDEAVAISGSSRSAFVRGAVLEKARAVVRDQRLTVLAWQRAHEFLLWLDQPAQVVPEMKRLADAPVFEHR